MSFIFDFAKHSVPLAQLNFVLYPSVRELVFSCREGELSVCIVFNSIDSITDLIGDPPDVIKTSTTQRYGIDLESIGTDRQRLYVDGQEDGEMLRGFYFDLNKNLLQLKKYKRSDGEYPISIDRYDHQGNLLNSDEPEYSGDSSLWTGPSELLEDAEGYDVIYLRKAEADQCYMRIMAK